MSLIDEIELDEKEQNYIKLKEQVAKLKSELTGLRRDHKGTLEQNVELRETLDLIQTIEASHAKPPPWAAPKKRQKSNIGSVAAMLSDLHLDEVVEFEEVEGLNKYNREIALLRLKRFTERTIILARDYVSGLDIQGMHLFLGGDMVSGFIHQELAETNEAPLPETVNYWLDHLSAAIGAFVEEFGKLHVAGVAGNHGRLTFKPRNKKRASDNIDWLIYRLLMRDFRNDDRVTWQVPESDDTTVTIHNHKYLLTHGDQFSGGNGISGIATPLTMGAYRKSKRAMQVDRNFDYMVLGHFHQSLFYKNIIVNGCFPAGSLVPTPQGMQSIESLDEGSIVLSRTGDWETVTHLFEKTGELVGFKVRGLPSLFQATPNHLVWGLKGISRSKVEPKWRDQIRPNDVERPQWIPAEFLSPGDWVHIPYPTGSETPYTKDLAYAFGLYLAEGHTLLDGGSTKKHNRIEFSMHIKEKPVLEGVKETLDAYLGKPGRIWTREDRTTSHLTYSVSRETAVEWREMFGHKAYGKRFPAEFFNMEPTLKKAVVQGWIDGDGHTRPDGVTSAATVSPQLAWGMFYLSLGAGHRPSLAEIKRGGPRLRDTYTVHFNEGQESMMVGGDLFYRIQHRFRNDVSVPVYDLEVTGEHTYCVQGVGVHNSLKGIDEFAYRKNYEFEPPQQAFWINTPERGFTFSAAVDVMDRKKEKW